MFLVVPPKDKGAHMYSLWWFKTNGFNFNSKEFIESWALIVKLELNVKGWF
jgi:hypothetical protein